MGGVDAMAHSTEAAIPYGDACAVTVTFTHFPNTGGSGWSCSTGAAVYCTAHPWPAPSRGCSQRPMYARLMFLDYTWTCNPGILWITCCSM